MHAKVELPMAFSVRDEHEFFPVQHLMARLNPQLVAKQVATGVHAGRRRHGVLGLGVPEERAAQQKEGGNRLAGSWV